LLEFTREKFLLFPKDFKVGIIDNWEILQLSCSCEWVCCLRRNQHGEEWSQDLSPWSSHTLNIVIVWLFIYPSDSCVKILTPRVKVIVLEDGHFGMWLDHESRDLMNRISALTKESQRRQFIPSHHVRTQEEVTNYEPDNELSVDTESAGILSFDFPAYRSVRNKFLFL
jgi:hypothetical protein